MLEIVKVINSGTKYTDKKGREHTQINYYVVVNNQFIAIRPAFKEGYGKLDLVCRVVKNGIKE